MAVYDLENGTRVVELGLGTTLVSTLIHEDSKAAEFIVFSPLDQENNNPGKLKGNEVLIRIANISGLAAYLLGMLNLLETWEMTGDIEKVMEVKRQLAEFCKTLQFLR